MDFQQAIVSGFQNYATFSGRASRSAYWWWFLFSCIGGFVIGLLDAALFSGDAASAAVVSPLNLVFNLAMLIPSIAVTTRRLHDVNKSGWWQLLCITIIGIIPLFYWYCKPGDEGGNRFGASPDA